MSAPSFPLICPQLSSIKQTQPPPLILAGAGTGKTTTITAKIAHMVECGIFDKSRVGAQYCVAVRGYVERQNINIQNVINVRRITWKTDFTDEAEAH